MKITEHARGRWPEIIEALVGEGWTDTRKHKPCPATGDGCDRFRFSNQHGSGNFFCGCNTGESGGLSLLMCVKGWTMREAIEAIESVIGKCPRDENEPAERKNTINDRIRGLARKSERSKYLEGRGLEMAPALMFCDLLEYYNEDRQLAGSFPAMLAPVTRAGEFLTWHVTYIHGGQKAKVNAPRKMMPGPHLDGGSVALYEPAKVIGIGEGIETCIAAKMLYDMPVWAALNTSLLKTWQPPKIAEEVVIFADKDQHLAGHAAAYALAHRLIRRGLRVTVEFPAEGKDFNDMLLARRKAA